MAAKTNRYEDDDASRLPPGMKRVGYDAETERYTFRQGEDLWLGEPGSLYGGRLRWAGSAPEPSPENISEESGAEEYTESNDSDFPVEYGKPKKSLPDNALETLPHLENSRPQENRNEWEVPVASISDTGAAPPDGLLHRRAMRLKDAALSKIASITVTRRGTKKWGNSRGAYRRPSSNEREDPRQESQKGGDGKQSRKG